jgi:hypothetical protein
MVTMSPEAGAPSDDEPVEDVAFEAFRDGLPIGRFRVVVNPDLARRYVAQRTHATPLALALVGPGIACALAGLPWIGVMLVAAGIGLKRAIAWQAPKILLHLASRQRLTYDDARAHGVMEVRRG